MGKAGLGTGGDFLLSETHKLVWTVVGIVSLEFSVVTPAGLLLMPWMEGTCSHM